MPNHLARIFLLALALVLPHLTACVADPADAEIDVIARDATEPDEALTPGSLCTDRDPDFDGYRYAEQIAHCVRHVSTSTKTRVYKEYGIALDTRGDYQIDHRLSLSFGGSNHMDNLWPLPYDDARRKAQLEEHLYLQISSGEIVQADAIAQILAWR